MSKVTNEIGSRKKN